MEDIADLMQAAVEYITHYVSIMEQIRTRQEEAEHFRAAAIEALQAYTAEVGTEWRFPGLATVTKARGRVSEKLDRSKLAKAGVAAELLDAATIRTEGEPSVRITLERG
jgi:AcrR family transcriptional regulator